MTEAVRPARRLLLLAIALLLAGACADSGVVRREAVDAAAWTRAGAEVELLIHAQRDGLAYDDLRVVVHNIDWLERVDAQGVFHNDLIAALSLTAAGGDQVYRTDRATVGQSLQIGTYRVRVLEIILGENRRRSSVRLAIGRRPVSQPTRLRRGDERPLRHCRLR